METGKFYLCWGEGGKGAGPPGFLSKYLSLCWSVGQFCLLINYSSDHSGLSFFSHLYCTLASIQISLFPVCSARSAQLSSALVHVPSYSWSSCRNGTRWLPCHGGREDWVKAVSSESCLDRVCFTAAHVSWTKLTHIVSPGERAQLPWNEMIMNVCGQ